MAALSTLNDLFVKELRDIYDAEKQLTKALPKMARAADSDELRSAIEEHLEQTRGQVDRLEQVFEQLDLRPRGQHCPGMEGLIEEGKHLLEEDADPDVLDAALIASAQKVEHYEIAAYGTLVAYAQHLGLDEAAALLDETLNEEKAADVKLTALAESSINAQAISSEDDEEQEEEEQQTPAAAGGRRTAQPQRRAIAADKARRR